MVTKQNQKQGLQRPQDKVERKDYMNIYKKKKSLPGIMRPDPNLFPGTDFPAPGTYLIPITLHGDLDSSLNLDTICPAHFAQGWGW